MNPNTNPLFMNRKEFLQWMAGAAAGLAAPALLTGCSAEEEGKATESPVSLPRRKLGSTGLTLPVLGLGGVQVGDCATEKDARALVDAAFTEGIRFFDTAEMYQNGGSETRLGAALKEVRQDVFLMTKTFSPEDRSAESARQHLERSLERLQTDSLDLWQLHGVTDEADVEKAFRPGGAMEYMLEAKEQGLVRHIGVTGHHRPATLQRALEFWDEGWKFDTMQFPLNPVDYHQFSFQRELLPEVVQRGIGVLAMKITAGGALLRENLCTAEECLRYVHSLPISIAIVGMETVEQLRSNAAVVRDDAAWTTEQIDQLLNRIEPSVKPNLEWYKV